MRSIIIIGMDNTGKTTLSHNLSQALGMPVVNSLGPKASYSDMAQFILTYTEPTCSVILERFCLFEELIYGNILRGESKFDWSGTYWDMVSRAEPFIVYCRPDRDTIFSFGTREQMEGVIQRKEALLLAFDDLYFTLKDRNFRVHRYNFKEHSFTKLVQLFKKEV